MIHTFLIYLGSSWGMISFITLVIDHYALSPKILDIAYILLLTGLPAAVAIAFFHGEKGKQKMPPVEYAILSLLLLIALSLTIRTILVPESPARGASRSTGGIVVEPNTIALLYFDNMSADSQDEYLSDGITEDIITALTRLGIFQVSSRTAVLQYKNRPTDMREMREDLKVSSLLEGSVRRIGNRVRITAQLFDTETGFHMWAQTFDREFEHEDVFTILDEVTEKIITALQENLSGQFRDLKLRRSTENAEAYDYYLRGRYHFYKYSKDDNEKAIGLFESACAIDPNFAEAYAGIADVLALAYHRYWDRRPETLEEAIRYARKALSISDEIAEAHAALGTAYLVTWHRGEDSGVVELSEKSPRRAIELDPAYDRARLNLVRILNRRGDYDESAPLLTGATDEGLHGYVEYLLGDVYPARGIPDTALMHYGGSLKWAEDSTGTFNKMGLTMQKLGRYDEALSCFQRASRSIPNIPRCCTTWDEPTCIREIMCGRIRRLNRHS